MTIFSLWIFNADLRTSTAVHMEFFNSFKNYILMIFWLKSETIKSKFMCLTKYLIFDVSFFYSGATFLAIKSTVWYHALIITQGNLVQVQASALSPYLTCAMSPTTISDTLICITCPPRTTVNFCSCSMRLWRPRNCFSLLQSLKAVTRTTHTTDSRMAAPSIHPASASPSSSTPPAALPQSEHNTTAQSYKTYRLP